MADAYGEPGIAAYMKETADAWNDSVERWTYVSGTDLAKEVGVAGYYVRIAPPEVSDAASPPEGSWQSRTARRGRDRSAPHGS